MKRSCDNKRLDQHRWRIFLKQWAEEAFVFEAFKQAFQGLGLLFKGLHWEIYTGIFFILMPQNRSSDSLKYLNVEPHVTDLGTG